MPEELCQTVYSMEMLCGTDGEDYDNISILRCAQRTEYGRRVNLQVKHDMGCWVWERYGIDTSIIAFILTVLIVLSLYLCFCRARRISRNKEIPFENLMSA